MGHRDTSRLDLYYTLDWSAIVVVVCVHVVDAVSIEALSIALSIKAKVETDARDKTEASVNCIIQFEIGTMRKQ